MNPDNDADLAKNAFRDVGRTAFALLAIRLPVASIAAIPISLIWNQIAVPSGLAPLDFWRCFACLALAQVIVLALTPFAVSGKVPRK